MVRSTNAQFLLITLLLASITIVRLSGYILTEIDECPSYHNCINNITETRLGHLPVSSLASTEDKIENTTEKIISSNRLTECFDQTFCDCTDDIVICQLESNDIMVVNLLSYVLFYTFFIYLLCSGCRSQIDIFDSQEDYLRFKIKLGLLLVLYSSFFLLNIFAGYLVQKVIYGYPGFQLRLDVLDFIWIAFAIAIPVYFTCYLRTRSPVFRYIFVARIETRLQKLEPSQIPDDECSICLEPFKMDETSGSDSSLNSLSSSLREGLIRIRETNHILPKSVVTTPCNHIFHLECIRPALIAQNKCPLCRTTIYEEGDTNTNTETGDQIPIVNYQSMRDGPPNV